MENIANLKQGENVARTAFILESFIAVGKVVIGIISGSLVLISDAIHSLSDLLSIFISWFGLKLAQKKPNDKFPYGYLKAENIGTLIISLVILYGSFQIFIRGYRSLFAPSEISYSLLALAISIIDAIVLFFFGRYEIRVGKKVNAQSLIAMGKENQTHIFTSSAVALGILSSIYNLPYIEGIITIIISLLVFRIGITSAKNAVLDLMDVSPGDEVEKQIRKVVESVPGVEEAYDLKLRKAGPYILGSTKAGIKKKVNVEKSHKIADQIEQKVHQQISQIDNFVVHIEPLESDYSHLIFPVKNKNKLDSDINSTMARAPYLLFVNLKKDKIKGYYFLDNPYKGKEVKAGLSVSKLIIKQKSTGLVTKQIGEIAFNTLTSNLVDIYKTNKDTVKQAISLYTDNSLKELNSPTKENNVDQKQSRFD